MPHILQHADGRRFDAEVGARLRATARRVWVCTVTEGLAVVLATALVLGAADWLIDWSLHLGLEQRIVGLILLGGILLALCIRCLFRPAARAPGPEGVARRLEHRFPQLEDRLISAVQLAQPPTPPGSSPELVQCLLDECRTRTRPLVFNAIIDRRHLRGRLMLIVGVAAALAAVTRFAPEAVGLFLERNLLLRDVNWPQKTYLRIDGAEDGIIPHPRGEDLRLTGRLLPGSVRPRQVFAACRFVGGGTERRPMVAVGSDRYRLELPQVGEEMRLRLTGGDATTDWVHVRVLDRPTAEDVQITVTPPGYTNLSPYALRPGQTAVQVLPGSGVSIAFETNVPVIAATIYEDQYALLDAERSANGRWTSAFVADTDAALHLQLTAEHGLKNDRPTRFSVHLLRDEPPDVQMDLGAAGSMVTPDAVLPISVTVTDRYGIADAAVVCDVSVAGDRPREIPLTGLTAGTKDVRTALKLEVASLGVGTGGVVRLWSYARDLDDVSGPNEGRSFTTMLRVVTREELLAELARREQEHRHEFERVLKRQEDLHAEILAQLAGAVGEMETAKREARRRWAELARQQRQLATRTGALRRLFARLLAELEINHLASSGMRRRLGGGIVDPLGELVRSTMPAIDADLRSADPDADRLDANLRAAIEGMRRVLANVAQQEGFQEAINLLRDVIDLQSEVRQQTEAELRRRIEDLFEPNGD